MKIVSLIGSARFKDEFLRLEKEITMKHGHLVLLPYLDGLLNKGNYNDDQWEWLMLHAFKRIEISDEIFVVNVNGYVGNHTAREIEHAITRGKKVLYLEKLRESHVKIS